MASTSTGLHKDMGVYTTQQKQLTSIIAKNKAIIGGTGYGGTAPNYGELEVDNADISNLAFGSADIYYPGVNVGYKEAHDTVSSLKRFAKTIAYTRQDYYNLEDVELTILGNYLSYQQQVITKLTKVPTK